MLLKDAHPTIAEILDGKHDNLLAAFDQATALRRKQKQAESGLRAGSRIRITDLGGDIAGRTGRILKVNKKTFSVVLACPTCGSDEAVSEDAPFDGRCSSCYGCPSEWRVAPALVEALA